MRTVNPKTTWLILALLAIVGGGAWCRSTQLETVEVQVVEPIVKQCAAQSLGEQALKATVVLEGTVAMVVPGERFAEVYIEPSRIFKGELVRPWRIFAHDESVRSDSGQQVFSQVRMNGQVENELSFASDQPPYLLFLQQTDGGYMTSRCDGSRLLGDGLTEAEKVALGMVR